MGAQPSKVGVSDDPSQNTKSETDDPNTSSSSHKHLSHLITSPSRKSHSKHSNKAIRDMGGSSPALLTDPAVPQGKRTGSLLSRSASGVGSVVGVGGMTVATIAGPASPKVGGAKVKTSSIPFYHMGPLIMPPVDHVVIMLELLMVSSMLYADLPRTWWGD